MNPEKQQTIKFLKAGDRKAFQFLYLKYECDFRTYAQHLTRGLYAEDLIQLTCLQILQYDRRHKDPEAFNFKGFFCRALHNTFINLHRTARPVVELPDNLIACDNGPYREHNYKQLLFHIDKYLSEDQKQVMYMRMKGIKFKQIARRMKISPNTASGIFRYGRKRLKDFKEKILESQ